MKRKIGILYVCTGHYRMFFEDFYLSMESLFMPDQTKHYYVWTDSTDIPSHANVTVIPTEWKSFPYETLFRFDRFVAAESLLEDQDYLIVFNANMKVLKQVNFTDIIDPNCNFFAVGDTDGIYGQLDTRYKLETNKKSLAYFNIDEPHTYIMGGLNGGSTKAFLTMSKVLSRNIHQDLAQNIIAVLHDESHMNHYMHTRECKIIPTTYMMPNDNGVPDNTQIVLIKKSSIMDLQAFRSTNKPKALGLNSRLKK